MADSPAAKIGLQKGDKIIGINGKPVDSYNEFTDQLGVLEDMMTEAKSQADSLKIRTATIVYARGEANDTATITLTPELKLGFFVQTIAGLYEPVTKEYGFFESDLLVHPEKLSGRKWARRCWNREFPAADYIVLDDAYQYRRLKATKTAVLVDYNRPVHKDMLMPLGRLRDLPERMYDSHAVVVTKCPETLDEEARARFVEEMGFTDYLPATCEATNPKGRRQQIFFTTVRYLAPEGVFPTAEPRFVYSKKVIVVTGIAKDGPLRSYLSDTYKIVKRFSFPDHHRYAWKDINRLQDAVKDHPTAAIITTEKDAQRLLDYSGMPEGLMQRIFMVPIEADFLSDTERELFAEFITQL